MRQRLLIPSGSAILVAAAIGLAATLAVPMAAQTSRPSPAVPRTADGHPDLQGTFNVATITPLERPAQYGNRLVLTAEEAAALERAESDRDQKLAEPSVSVDQRTAPPVGGDRPNPNATTLERIFEAGGGTIGGYNSFWIAAGSQVVSIKGEKRSSIIVDPPDGRVPRMKPDAMRRNTEYLRAAVSPGASEGSEAGPASAYDDPERRPLAERCLLGFGSTSGPPTLPNYFYNNLKQIVQTGDKVMILNEMVHDARIIRIGGQHLPSSVRLWMGDSIGRWEGDTLVVETTNFTTKTQFRGASENLKVTERFTRADQGTIHYRFVVEDPLTWDRPWTGEYPWVRTDDKIFEYACHEGNYGLEGVLRGARATDKAGGK